jgi:hypothetical protein
MAGNSKESLLSWLALQSRTQEWDSVVVIDRSKLNLVLIQGYIDRFNSESYFPPITDSTPTVPTQTEYLYDFTLDYPRLSFEKADLSNSKAALSMRVVGGTQVTIETNLGIGRAIRVDSTDPLDAPTLELVISLSDAPGTVDSSRNAILDLAKGGEFRLTYADTQFMQEKLGALFKKQFEAVPHEKRVYILTTLQEGGDNYMIPQRFEIRTQSSGAAARNPLSSEFGQGAVLLFVAMEKGDSGGFPDPATFKYLIPDDAVEDYSATVLLSSKMLGRALFTRGFIKAFEKFGAAFKETFVGDKLTTIQATLGSYTVPSGYFDYGGSYPPPWDVNTDAFTINLAGAPLPVIADFTQANVGLKWQFAGKFSGKFNNRLNNSSADFVANYQFDIHREYILADGASSGKEPYFILSPEYRILSCNVSMPEGVGGSYQQKLVEMSQHYILEGATKFLYNIGDEFYDSDSVKSSIMGDVRIPFGNALEFNSLHIPRDAVLFGKVSPAVASFVINPLEVIVGHGATYSFLTVPETHDLTWEVNHVPGGSGDEGEIDNTGRYTAPSAEKIKGTYIRVKVTATSANGYSSSALVSVVVRDITVNPVIQICDAYDSSLPAARQHRQLWAGTLGSGKLEWNLKYPDRGGKVLSNGEPRDGHNYFAMPKVANTGFVVEEVLVTNLSTGNSQSSYVLVVHTHIGISISIDTSASLPTEQLKLQGSINGVVNASITWRLLEGAGAIDSVTGIYTVDPGAPELFSVITALLEYPGLGKFQGFLILPLPLTEFASVLKTFEAR